MTIRKILPDMAAKRTHTHTHVASLLSRNRTLTPAMGRAAIRQAIQRGVIAQTLTA
jgi:hypothetical protein